MKSFKRFKVLVGFVSSCSSIALPPARVLQSYASSGKQRGHSLAAVTKSLNLSDLTGLKQRIKCSATGRLAVEVVSTLVLENHILSELLGPEEGRFRTSVVYRN